MCDAFLLTYPWVVVDVWWMLDPLPLPTYGYSEVGPSLFRMNAYRASHVLEDLGWVDLDFGNSWLVGRYCSYLLPKQDGGTSQSQVNKTQSTRTWDTLYTCSTMISTFLCTEVWWNTQFDQTFTHKDKKGVCTRQQGLLRRELILFRSSFVAEVIQKWQNLLNQ